MTSEGKFALRLKRILPSVTVIALLIALWWLLVTVTHSAIFPTPWQVVMATAELIRDGTLWGHIGASLLRVGAGFGLAVLFAVPAAEEVDVARVVVDPVQQVIVLRRPDAVGGEHQRRAGAGLRRHDARDEAGDHGVVAAVDRNALEAVGLERLADRS